MRVVGGEGVGDKERERERKKEREGQRQRDRERESKYVCVSQKERDVWVTPAYVQHLRWKVNVGLITLHEVKILI